jgi:hypothetical protein
MTRLAFVLFSVAWLAGSPALAQPKSPLAELLARELLPADQVKKEFLDYLDPKVPRLPEFKTVAEWEAYAGKVRRDMLDHVVFRGEAAKWRDAKTKVEYLDTLTPGPGYKVKKLRYEALPGLWIPALLYEPEKLEGKVPVSLAVNGHDRVGKAAEYKQMRCINMAKRGMLVLNVEWLGMGQLRTDGFQHGRMNQLDLCGTSGLAPFYLAMSRGLDLLLGLPHADPKRVVVSGLSGGGWQTIFISSLDTRVTLTNPVAGYSGNRTRLRHHKDLGDSEQTPCDMNVYADYTHLTALMAPRPTLLTYNAKDECCFEAGYALPPLLDAARPIFKLYDREKALRSHINTDPGTHNFLLDNRQALYRMLGDFFFADDKAYRAEEIPSKGEVKTRNELDVELPEKNADFHTLALSLAAKLPHNPDLPRDKEAALGWQQQGRKRLEELVKPRNFAVKATRVNSADREGTQAVYWKLRLGDDWTVPVVELVRGQPKATALLLNDAGLKNDPVTAERLLGQGYRVLAVDLAFSGDQAKGNNWLFALAVATVGERPLGLQASQLAAVARWSQTVHHKEPLTVVAVGPKLGVAALVAAALEEKALGRLELHGALGSLKEVIEQNRSVEQMPALFCFGLLEALDVKQLTALAAPRPVSFVKTEERARKELGDLKRWYGLLGRDFDPLAAER